MRNILLFSLSFIFIISASLNAQTYVSGQVSGTWTKANSPYIVTDDITVSYWRSLIIESGVKVLFRSGKEFNIYGEIQALGSESDSVIFSHNHPDSTWGGFYISGSRSGSLFKYCCIEYSNSDWTGRLYGSAILCSESNIEFSNCTFKYNESRTGGIPHRGVVAFYMSDLIKLNSCKFTNNNCNGTSIFIFGSSTVYIFNSKISDKFTEGNSVIVAWSDNSPNKLFIYNSAIVDNWGGIYVSPGNICTVSNCVIYNTESAFVARENSTINIQNSVFSNSGNIDIQTEDYAIEYSNLPVSFAGNGNINSDPSFVNPDNGNFQLQSNSPCIDAGNPWSFYNDRDGSRNDMGIHGGSGILASPQIIDYGMTGKGQEKRANFSIFNTNNDSLIITSISFTDSENFSTNISLPDTILPNTSSDIPLVFNPSITGTISERAIVEYSNNSKSDTASVFLNGFAGYWSGEVSGMWTQDNSPYILGGDVFIPTGATLKINPGVVVQVDTNFAGSSAKIIVEGSLEAIGTETDSIVFTMLPGQEISGGWHGLDLILVESSKLSNAMTEKPVSSSNKSSAERKIPNFDGIDISEDFDIDGLADGNAHLYFCRVEYAKTGITAKHDNIIIKNSTIQNNSEHGVWWYGNERSASGELINCTIQNNGGRGIYCRAVCEERYGFASPVIDGNVIQSNGEGGIYAYALGWGPWSWSGSTDRAYASPETINNYIIENSGSGIECYAIGEWTDGVPFDHWSYAYASPVLSGNIITNNESGLQTSSPGFDHGRRISFSEIIMDQCTFSGNQNFQITSDDSAVVSIGNSIFWNSPGNAFEQDNGGEILITYSDSDVPFSGDGNINMDPAFVDAAAGDFNLTYLSPCIDAGNPDSTKDADSTRVDMGALYYHQSIAGFQLTAPETGETVHNATPLLKWEYPVTAGEESLTFDLYLNTRNSFADSNTILYDGISATNFVVTDSLQDYKTYFWQVIAKNPWGLEKACSQPFNFTVNTDTLPPYFTDELPHHSFNEDDSSIALISEWYDVVEDSRCPDSTLFFQIKSGVYISAQIENDSCFFKSDSLNWFGVDTLWLSVTDKSQLSDSAKLVVHVNPINDSPIITGLPDSLVFRSDSTKTLNLWQHTTDVETADSLLEFGFSVIYDNPNTNDSLQWNYSNKNGDLTLSSSSIYYIGKMDLCISVLDDSSSAARDTLAIRIKTRTEIAENLENNIPNRFELHQNYPNPFNPQTTISFAIPNDSEVIIEIYNVRGERVSTIFQGKKSAGVHSMIWKADHFSSGTYFIKMKAGDFVDLKKCVLLK